MSIQPRQDIGPSIELETALAIGLWPTFCDPNQLENAVLNLAINGKDAMPEGRPSHDRDGKYVDRRSRLELPRLVAWQYVQVSVTDTRVGMPPDVIARAFDPFFTTKADRSGHRLVFRWSTDSRDNPMGRCASIPSQAKGRRSGFIYPATGTAIRKRARRRAARRRRKPPTMRRFSSYTTKPTIRMIAVEVLQDLGYRATRQATEHRS